MNSIFHHVSIRKYKKQPVEKEKIISNLELTKINLKIN